MEPAPTPDTDPRTGSDAPAPAGALPRRTVLVGIAAAAAGVAAAASGGLLRLAQRGSQAGATAPAGAAGAAPSTGAPTTSSTGASRVETTEDGTYRYITSNGLPDHAIDPEYRYVSTPSEQSHSFRLALAPERATTPTEVVTGQLFGVHRNGVPFDPATAGFYEGDRDSGWLQEALAYPLDDHGAHTQPGGTYHYHAVTGAWKDSAADEHGPLVGWAADGFPVYLRRGYADAADPDSGVRTLAASWRLRSGARPDGSPGGTYDGTWVQDYEYVDGLGDLDECNGRECVTPDHPDGTYAYFLTDEFPAVPRWLRGTPDGSFHHGPPSGTAGAGGPGGDRPAPPGPGRTGATPDR